MIAFDVSRFKSHCWLNVIKKVLKLSGCSQPLKGWKRLGQFIGGRSYAEKSNLPQLYNPFSFINYHILASDVGPRLVNSIFYSFHNFVLFASVRRRFQVFFLRTGLHFALLFTPIPRSNANKIYTLPRIVKTSFLTLQFLIRQQDQEFDQQCILPVNKAAVAVSDKLSSHITDYKCHNSYHNPNRAYSFSSITSFNP